MTDPTLSKPSANAKLIGIAVALVTSFAVREGIKAYRDHENEKREERAALLGVSGTEADRVSTIMESAFASADNAGALKRYMENRVRERVQAGEKFNAIEYSFSLGKNLSARGIARLDDEDLSKMQTLKATMVAASERACPCYWDPGTCSNADMYDGLARLTDRELRTWADLSAKATNLEIAAVGPLPDVKEAFSSGLTAILGKLPAADRDHMRRILDSKAAGKADQCFAIRAVFNGLQTLAPVQKASFIRALTVVSVP